MMQKLLCLIRALQRLWALWKNKTTQIFVQGNNHRGIEMVMGIEEGGNTAQIFVQGKNFKAVNCFKSY